MREFIFRVWDSSSKTMSEPFSYKDLHGHIECGSNVVGIFDLTELEGITFVRHGVHPVLDGILPSLKIMQSTGLKDKNGKLIFEGDICMIDAIPPDRNHHLSQGVVEWDSVEAAFVVITRSCWPVIMMQFIKQIEIIGNQFENPELLEGVQL